MTGKGRLYGPDGTEYGDSEGLFIKLAPKQIEQIDAERMSKRLHDENAE